MRKESGCSVLSLLVCVSVCASCGGSGGGTDIPPTVSFVAPAAAVQVAPGAMVDVTYADADPDSVATTTILADVDGDLATTAEQVVVAANRPEQDGAPQTVTWDTTGVTPGTYRLFAVTTDGTTTVVAEAAGTVALGTGNVPPSVTSLDPTGDISVCPGAPVAITYVDDDPDDAASTSLFADDDGDPAAGLIPIDVDRAELNGTPQTVTWDTTGVAPGTYYVIASSDDSVNPVVYTTAAGTITVTDALAPTVVVQDASSEPEAALATSSFADGSFVSVGAFGSGTGSASTFGGGEANETTLTTDGGFDYFVARYNADGTLAWARGGGLTGDGLANCYKVATFTDGSCVVVGYFRGELTIAANTMLSLNDSDDLFVAKFDASGAPQWAHRVGGDEQDLALDVAGFPDGSFVITGGLGSTSIFGPGEANQTTVDVVFAEAKTFYVAKYASDGTFLWVQTQETAGSDLGTGIVGFSDGSCVAYWRRNSSGSFGIADYYVTRYDADGNLVWSRATGAANAVVFGGIAGYADGSFVVTGNAGFYFASTTFGAGDPNETTVTAVDNDDIFVARYNADGTLRWARMFGGDGSDYGSSVAALPGGGCAITGRIDDTVTVAGQALSPAGGFDPILVYFTGDGTATCADHWGNTPNEAASVSSRPDGTVLVTGYFTSPITVGTTTLTSAGGNDYFVARYAAR